MPSVDSLLVKIDASTELLRRELKKGDASVRDFANKTDRHLDRFEKRFQRIGRSAGRALSGLGVALGAGGIAVGLQNAARRAIDFERSLSRVVGLVGTSREEVAAFRAEVGRLGRSTGRGPQELADAFFFVQSAGIEGAAAIDVLERSAKAASAGLGSTATVADAVTSAINAYGAANLSASEATDILVATVREGKAGAETIATALGRVIPIASEMGVEFEEVGATIAALTRVGASAEEASTALAAALQSMLTPGTKAETTLRRFELSVSDVRRSIKERGLLDTLLELKETFGDNETAMAEVFSNARALRGILGLVGNNAEEVREVFRELGFATGALDKAYAAWAETIDGRLSIAMTNFEEQSIRLGSIVLPALATSLEKVVDLFSGMAEASRDAGAAIVEVGEVSLEGLFQQLKNINRELETLEQNQYGPISSTINRLLGGSGEFETAGGSREELEARRETVIRLIQELQRLQKEEASRARQLEIQSQLTPFTDEDRQRLNDLVNQSITQEPVRVLAEIDFDSKAADRLRERWKDLFERNEATIGLREQLRDIEIETLRAEGKMEEAIRASAARRIEGIREAAKETDVSAAEIEQAIANIGIQTEASVAQFRNLKKEGSEFATAFAAAFESRGMQALLDGDIHDAMRGFLDDIVELIFRLTVLKPLTEQIEGFLEGIGTGSSGGGNSLAQQPSGGGVIGSILGGIFGRRQSGGPVSKNRPYVIGEAGPEVFVPNVAGRIVTASRRQGAAASAPIVIEQSFDVQAGLPPQWEGQLAAVAQLAATTAHDAITRQLSGRR